LVTTKFFRGIIKIFSFTFGGKANNKIFVIGIPYFIEQFGLDNKKFVTVFQ